MLILQILFKTHDAATGSKRKSRPLPSHLPDVINKIPQRGWNRIRVAPGIENGRKGGREHDERNERKKILGEERNVEKGGNISPLNDTVRDILCPSEFLRKEKAISHSNFNSLEDRGVLLVFSALLKLCCCCRWHKRKIELLSSVIILWPMCP